jgi:hypothetical protein
MTEAPERIWIEDEFGEGDDDQWTYGAWDVRNYAGYNVEYVRADLALPAVQPDLTDPAVVHLNMLRGTIAKPSLKQIIHLYGVDALAPLIVREAGNEPS